MNLNLKPLVAMIAATIICVILSSGLGLNMGVFAAITGIYWLAGVLGTLFGSEKFLVYCTLLYVGVILALSLLSAAVRPLLGG
jgi:hypothetical protein